MNARNQRLCAWGSIAMITVMLTGLLVAGFLPLPAPSMTAPEVASLIYAHTLRIQLGMVLLAVGAAFLGPFVAELTVQMRRIEGEHSPLSWLQLGFGTLFVGVVSTAVVQCAAIAIAIMGDERAEPIFPRWVGLFNVWTAIIFSLGGVIVFFKHGPLAWNGLFTFWIPLSIYGGWLGVMLRAITIQERSQGDVPSADLDTQRQLDALTAEVTALRAEFSRR